MGPLFFLTGCVADLLETTSAIAKQEVREAMVSYTVHKNIALRQAIVVARELGAEVRHNSSGEIRFTFVMADGTQRRFNVNSARKDTPQDLVAYLRQRVKALEPVAA